jgi:hypothetical protein
MPVAFYIRLFLLTGVILMALLAILYLYRKNLTMAAFIGWGLLALLIPVLGPFLVISSRPGSWSTTSPGLSRAHRRRRTSLQEHP